MSKLLKSQSQKGGKGWRSASKRIPHVITHIDTHSDIHTHAHTLHQPWGAMVTLEL